MARGWRKLPSIRTNCWRAGIAVVGLADHRLANGRQPVMASSQISRQSDVPFRARRRLRTSARPCTRRTRTPSHRSFQPGPAAGRGSSRHGPAWSMRRRASATGYLLVNAFGVSAVVLVFIWPLPQRNVCRIDLARQSRCRSVRLRCWCWRYLGRQHQ